ncbi:MAG: hypothetical protein HN674_07830 [Candidatus Marinimicrobia bacterium]|nr:hypothetical protein [Candidatus Neomarinimicrobiota bacterium]
MFQTGNNNFVFKMWKDEFIIQYFFTEDIEDSDRWDFIEDFFLGKGESDLLQLVDDK